MIETNFMPLADFKKIALPWDKMIGVYSTAQEVQWQKWLNGFFVHNTGTTNVVFGGDLILPGDSKTYGGNWGEIYMGRLDFFFQLQVPNPPTITNQVRIEQKYYRYPS